MLSLMIAGSAETARGASFVSGELDQLVRCGRVYILHHCRLELTAFVPRASGDD